MDWAGIESRVRTVAAEEGRSLSDVLSSAGLNKNWLCSPERNPTIGSLNSLSKAMGCSPAYLMRQVVPHQPAPKKSARQEIAALKPTGSDIPKVFQLWGEHNGVITPEFMRALDKLDLWSRTQLYAHEEGLYIYGWVGDFYLETLGAWAIEAPGQICGDGDPDPAYAKWCMQVWQKVMDQDLPRRYACQARSSYRTGKPELLNYEAFYAPVIMSGKRHLMMVAQVMEGFLDVQN